MDSYSSCAEGVQQVQLVKPALPQRKMSKNYLKKEVGSKIRKCADGTKLFRPVGQGQTVKYFKDCVTEQ